MTAVLHPAIRADWLVLRRAGWVAFARIIGVPALLLACCTGLACADFYGGYGWCLATSALLALGGSHATAHARLLDASERWRCGWCGGLSIGQGATMRTLLLATTVALLVSLAFVAVLLACVALPATHRADLTYALAGMGLGLVVGTATAAVRVFRRRSNGPTHHEDGIREPLFTLAWLDDPRLPHLLDWQRRAAVARWRRGGSFVLVGIVLAGVPDGPAIPTVVALTLLVLSWAWLAVVMRASADSTGAMVRLLGATPLDLDRARKTSLRYPGAALLVAVVPMAIGTVLGHSGMIVLAWAIAVCAASAWPLVRILGATRRPESPA
jgi:hypothetical protein